MSQDLCDIIQIPADCLKEIIVKTDMYSLLNLRVTCKLFFTMVNFDITQNLRDLITFLVYYIIKILKHDSKKIIRINCEFKNRNNEEISEGLSAWFKSKNKNGKIFIKMGEGEERNKFDINGNMTTDQEVIDFFNLIIESIEENIKDVSNQRIEFSHIDFYVNDEHGERKQDNPIIENIISKINGILNEDIQKTLAEFVAEVGTENIENVIYNYKEDYLTTSELLDIMKSTDGETATRLAIEELKKKYPPPRTYGFDKQSGGYKRRSLKRL